MTLKILTKFNKYWSVMHEIMGVAVVLYPRYKTSLLKFYFSRVYGTDSSVQIDNTKKLYFDLVDDYQRKMNA